MLLAALICLPASAVEKAKRVNRALPQKEMALQLYSIRSVFGDNNYAEKHGEIFKRLKAMGFTSVEAAGYNDGKFKHSSRKFESQNLCNLPLTLKCQSESPISDKFCCSFFNLSTTVLKFSIFPLQPVTHPSFKT